MGFFILSRRQLRKYLQKYQPMHDQFQAIHKHLDFIHSDMFTLLKGFLSIDESVELVTNYKVAYESMDHLHPLGTINDNTRCPKFFWRCEQIFSQKDKLRFLDMGCSSGGLVLDALLRGHFAIGLEGSDLSQKEQRSQWRIIPNNLFTCDISKDFTLRNCHTGETQKFDVISMWDVLEHISENDLPQLFSNIKRHLSADGIFFASIANSESIHDGVDLHITQKPIEWWEKRFTEYGFEITTPLEPQYMPRGAFNPPHVYMEQRQINDQCFAIAAKQSGIGFMKVGEEN